MEPFSKDDPLYDLLGKARPVDPRPNFTQNVMRSIRNTPQEKLGWWASLLVRLKIKINTEWRPTPALAAVAAAIALVLGLSYLQFGSGSGTTDPVGNPGVTIVSNDNPVPDDQLTITEADAEPESDASITAFEEAVEETPAEAAVASELDSMDQLSDLLASQDTSSLTDGEIAMLLY